MWGLETGVLPAVYAGLGNRASEPGPDTRLGRAAGDSEPMSDPRTVGSVAPVERCGSADRIRRFDLEARLCGGALVATREHRVQPGRRVERRRVPGGDGSVVLGGVRGTGEAP